MATSNKGFGAMSKEKVSKIASMGGRMSGGNFKNNPEKAREAGRKGGKARSRNRNNAQ